MPDNPVEPRRQVIDEPPPVLGTWPRVYAVVLAWLAALVALFYTFARAYTP
jgi:hypothetical protein